MSTQSFVELNRIHLLFNNRKFSRVTTLDKWIVILGLADRWEFPEVKELAISSIENLPISSVKRIALYQKYKVPMAIIAPHYVALCSRQNTLTVDEAGIIGNSTSIMIFTVRERLLSSQKGVCTLDKLDAETLQGSIRSYFDEQKKTNGQTKVNQRGKAR